MGLFGSPKKEARSAKSGEKSKDASKTHARAHALPEGRAHEVVRAPWFSEKALLSTDKGVYAFVIPSDATKADVAGAVKEVYNVKPKKVRIVNLPAKKVSLRTRRGTGSRAARRKAYVYLHAGDTIKFA